MEQITIETLYQAFHEATPEKYEVASAQWQAAMAGKEKIAGNNKSALVFWHNARFTQNSGFANKHIASRQFAKKLGIK